MLNKQTLFVFMNENTKFHTVCLYVADPANFANTILGPYFFLREQLVYSLMETVCIITSSVL